MAEEKESSRDVFWTPVVLALKCIGLFFDVATLMARMLFNTLFHDTPQGKLESVAERHE